MILAQRTDVNGRQRCSVSRSGLGAYIISVHGLPFNLRILWASHLRWYLFINPMSNSHPTWQWSEYHDCAQHALRLTTMFASKVEYFWVRGLPTETTLRLTESSYRSKNAGLSENIYSFGFVSFYFFTVPYLSPNDRVDITVLYLTCQFHSAFSASARACLWKILFRANAVGKISRTICGFNFVTVNPSFRASSTLSRGECAFSLIFAWRYLYLPSVVCVSLFPHDPLPLRRWQL